MDQQLQNVWKRYLSDATPEDEDYLARAYLPLVPRTVSRIRGTKIETPMADRDDHIQTGYLGLLDAIRQYDPNKGAAFETYATHKIESKVKDALRSNDPLSRPARTKVKAVRQAFVELEAKNHTAPTDAEIAKHLNIRVSDVRTAWQYQSASFVSSLDELRGDSGSDGGASEPLADRLTDDRMQTPHGALESAAEQSAVREVVATLSERERQVIALYYYERLTLKDIGTVLGVTESRVCQILNRVQVVVGVRLRAALFV